MDMKEEIYKPKTFATLIGVTVKTLQRWDRRGYLIAHRTVTNRRFYTRSDYMSYLDKSARKVLEK